MDSKKNTSSSSSKTKKASKNIRSQNVLEALKDIGGSTAQTLRNDVLKAGSEEFFKQMFGGAFPARKISGELRPGESMEMDKAYSGEHEKLQKQNRELAALNRLRQEDEISRERDSGRLKMQLNVLQDELVNLVNTTQNLAKETQVAAMTAPVETREYSISYITQIIEFIKSFRKKMNKASIWMGSSNSRAQKKNFWSKYKSKKQGGGSQHLLNSEHYLTRSAG